MPQFDRTATLNIVGESLLAEIKDLRIQFAIKKTETSEPNTALITVSNLSYKTRNLLGTTGLTAILQSGYAQDPQNVRVISAMDVVDVQSVTNAPQVTTAILCGDGMNVQRQPPKARSYAPGKSAKDILVEVVKDAGMTLRDISDVASDIYNNGFSEAGPFSDIMDKLTGKLEARWSVQNGEVVVTPLDQPAETSTVELNDSTGLITSQRRNKLGTPRSPGQKDGWATRSLLLPIVEPGSRVRLDTIDVGAVFRVVALSHLGDTEGQEYYTELELEEFDG